MLVSAHAHAEGCFNVCHASLDLHIHAVARASDDLQAVVFGEAQNQNPVIRSNGKFIRDYIYAVDGAHAYLTLAEAMMPEAKFAGEAFNFSYGLRLSVIDVVQKILTLMKREDLAPKILNEADNEIPVQSLNSDKAKKLLGWKPQFGFDEGLKLTVEWYKKLLIQ